MDTEEKQWPEPPVNPDGSPKSWIVATKAFNKAAQIGMHLNGETWELNIERRPDDDRPCYLVGYYDEDYDSFHIDRCFNDGTRERVYNPSQSTDAPNYKILLDIMDVWQSCARFLDSKEHEVKRLENLPGFDRLLYDTVKPA